MHNDGHALQEAVVPLKKKMKINVQMTLDIYLEAFFSFEINQKYKQPDIVNVIKRNRLGWLGNLY